MRFCNRITFDSQTVNQTVRPIDFSDGQTVRPIDDNNKSSNRLTVENQSNRLTVENSSNRQKTLRDRWPFLSEPSVPVELQALVTQRVTRYHEYTALYAQLRDCTDTDQCADVAGRLLDAYADGRQIAAELDYYQQHHRVLGRHPLLRHYQQLARLRSSSVKDLLREQQKTRDNIWRVNSEMRKGDKPHLDERRRQKLQEYELKLQEINRLLGE